MSDAMKLIERLRSIWIGPGSKQAACEEAAALIEQQAKDIAALRNALAASKQDAATAWERHAMANRIGNANSDRLAQANRDIAALQSDIEAQIRIASEEATRAANWKRMLQAVTSEIDDREYSEPWRLIENAPGHGHEKPGVWDQDNGKKAGKPCAWCLVWNEARAALARKEP